VVSKWACCSGTDIGSWGRANFYDGVWIRCKYVIGIDVVGSIVFFIAVMAGYIIIGCLSHLAQKYVLYLYACVTIFVCLCMYLFVSKWRIK
jgi:hypothetical protein